MKSIEKQKTESELEELTDEVIDNIAQALVLIAKDIASREKVEDMGHMKLDKRSQTKLTRELCAGDDVAYPSLSLAQSSERDTWRENSS